jgi:AcrR family transcriptional regulator
VATRAIDTRPASRGSSSAGAERTAVNHSEGRVRRYDPAETRSRVLAAAYRLFSTRGFAGTGTADIAREADVSEGSIFYHFGSKQKLLEELGRRHGEQMIAFIEQGDALEALEPGIIIPRVFEFCRTDTMWDAMGGDCESSPRARLQASADAEPFYHAAKGTMIDWIARQMAASMARRGITGVEIDIAASFTHHVVGDAIDRIFMTDDAVEQSRVERETIRFVRAACNYDCPGLGL